MGCERKDGQGEREGEGRAGFKRKGDGRGRNGDEGGGREFKKQAGVRGSYSGWPEYFLFHIFSVKFSAVPASHYYSHYRYRLLSSSTQSLSFILMRSISCFIYFP